MSQLVAVFNQFVYIALVLSFYILKVHLPMHQIQLDTVLIDDRLAKHREIYTDTNSLLIVYDNPTLVPSLEGFRNKAKNFFKLENVDLVEKSSSIRFKEYEYVLFVEKGSHSELKISNDLMNRFTIFYTSFTDLQAKLSLEGHTYLKLITDSSFVPFSKAYATVYAKILYLNTDQETKALSGQTVKAVRASDKVKPAVERAIRQVAGEHVEIEHISNFNVKNTFGIFVNSATPNEDQLKKHFQAILDQYDEEFVESRPTLGLNLLIETVSKPVKPDTKRYHVYRNCLYLKTSPEEAAEDISRAIQYLVIHAFGLVKLSDSYRDIFGKENYPAVLRLANQLRERRVLKTSLVFLESLRYINQNTNLAIKTQHLQPLNEALQNYEEYLQKRDLVKLRELSDYNEHAYFYSTYLFDPYVTGLLLIIFISGVSPLIKVIKEQAILTVVYCRRKKYLDKDINALSSLDWFFMRSFVAIDKKDFESDEEEDEDNPPPEDPNKSEINKDETKREKLKVD